VTRLGRFLRLAGWAGGIALALAALAASGHGALAPPPLGSPDRWQAWFEQRDPASAAFAILRMAAVGGCWYLAATVVLGTALRLVRADTLVAIADRFTVAPIRQLLAGSVTLTLAGIGPTGMLAAAAQPAPPASSTSVTTSTSTSTSVPASASATTPPATVTMRRLPPPAPPGADGPLARADLEDAGVVADRWTVQPGDCFWTSADDVLQRAWDQAPTDAEIVPYWLRLIEANRSELADPANPDLIFPGQVFTVPPPPPAGTQG